MATDATKAPEQSKTCGSDSSSADAGRNSLAVPPELSGAAGRILESGAVDTGYVCNACGLPLPLRLPLPGEVASSWECRYCGNRFYATLVDHCPPEVLTNVRPAEDVHPRIAIGGHVLAELHKRDGRPGRGFDERIHPRVQTDVSLSISIEGLPITAHTLDLSAGGLSFLSEQKVEIGAEFTARFESIPGRPTAKCSVRNCVELRPGSYRVGAEFHSAMGE